MTRVRGREGRKREEKRGVTAMQMITGHVTLHWFTDWNVSLTCSVPKCVMMRSVFSFSNLLERCFSCVGPPVNLQVILTLKRFSTRLTDEISDPCKKTLLHLEVYEEETDRTSVSS